MAAHPDYPRTRLFVALSLTAGMSVLLDARQSHYLIQVLRRKAGDEIALFNGRDGEWKAVLDRPDKKAASLVLSERLRPQNEVPDGWLLAAPLKSGKHEFVLEKATELGIRRFCPVLTCFTVVDKINAARLETIAREAAEQCERLDVPLVDPLAPLEARLGNWPQERLLFFADESGGSAEPGLPLASPLGPFALLIGPEGGFSGAELAQLHAYPAARGLSLGPRILRADTAAIAALAVLMAWRGDWKAKPAFRARG